jgi:hypothetical protein
MKYRRSRRSDAPFFVSPSNGFFKSEVVRVSIEDLLRRNNLWHFISGVNRELSFHRISSVLRVAPCNATHLRETISPAFSPPTAAVLARLVTPLQRFDQQASPAEPGASGRPTSGSPNANSDDLQGVLAADGGARRPGLSASNAL